MRGKFGFVGFYVAAICVLASCSGGLQSVPQSGGNSESGGKLAPLLKVSGQPSPGYVYYGDQLSGKVTVLRFPLGKQLAVLKGPKSEPAAICTDRSGNAFVTYYSSLSKNVVDEYAPGAAAPSATLDLFYQPSSCSVDPKTHNLAVAEYNYESRPPGVEIFPNASGTAQFFYDSNLPGLVGCGYDGSGNLFVAGTSSEGKVAISELPYGSKRFVDLTTPSEVADRYNQLRTLRWDGKYMTIGSIGDASYEARVYQIFRFFVSKRTVKIQQVVALNVPDDYFDESSSYDIRGNLVVATTRSGAIAEFAYPKGGNALQTSKQLSKYVSGSIAIGRAGRSN
jgi:hypothetical protein